MEDIYAEILNKVMQNDIAQTDKAVAITHSSLHDLPQEISPRACLSANEMDALRKFNDNLFAARFSDNDKEKFNKMTMKAIG